VLLGSDKAHLTDYSGDKSAWPVYMSIGNIHSSIRNKPSANCWILLAYIPIPLFNDHKDLHTSLQQRLFHQCLKVIVSSLKRAGERGELFTDSLGHSRLCFPRIAAYLADYPEQVLINVAAPLNSSVTTAGFHGLGDMTPHPRRTKRWILSKISELRNRVDPDDVTKYLVEAKKVGMNAVDQPFWEELPGYEPDLVICPDLLHGVFRMWRDHILSWVRYLVGVKELDRRIKALQPLVGMRHFANGISHLSQWSGREDRELQRVLIVAIAGAPRIDVNSMRCLRAFHDFLYLAQYRSHTTTTLGYLEQSYTVFHQLKNTFIQNNARRGKKDVIKHFCFPKMAGLQMYAYHIPRMGTSVQFSTEITETCHQTMAKAPYRATNRRDFFIQMCAYMNRQARVTLVGEFGAWSFERMQTQAATRDVRETSDYLAFVRRMADAAKRNERLEVRNKSRAGNGFSWLTIKPDKSRVPVDTLLRDYNLRTASFHASFISLLARYSPRDMPVSLVGLECDVWYQCRVQRTTIQDEDTLADTRTIRADPPTVTKTPHGRCNCALIKESDEAEETGIQGMRQSEDRPQYLCLIGYSVGQVRLIFKPRLPIHHPLHDLPMAYVYWFSKPSPRAERDINMYKLQYLRGAGNARIGGIVVLSSISRLIQMVPVYGPQVNPQLSSDNSMDLCQSYYVNSFMDKETYQAVW
jgi:Plavaka transposase